MPIEISDPSVLLGARFVIGKILSQVGGAVSGGMLGVCGVIAILLVLRRKWLAQIAASLIFVWASSAGSSRPALPCWT